NHVVPPASGLNSFALVEVRRGAISDRVAVTESYRQRRGLYVVKPGVNRALPSCDRMRQKVGPSVKASTQTRGGTLSVCAAMVGTGKRNTRARRCCRRMVVCPSA